MAKRRRSDRGERGISTPSTASFESELLRPVRLVSPVSLEPIRSLIEIEDRRLFHPARALQPALTTTRKADARLVARPARKSKGSDRYLHGASSHTGNSIASFRQPANVAVCVRRKQRREVLFANRKTGKGASSRFRRRNSFSNVSC